MRLKAKVWVKAYLRRCASHGAMGVVVRHGDDDAGAIYIKVLRGDGLCALFGPAPAGLEDADFDRRWVAMLKGAFVSEEEVRTRIEREARIDSDLWLLEIEDRDGKHFLGDDLLETKS
ncbi:MAG TPA: DUF1491 family protein [Hyphomicrobium sp.]|nr:DUF1491 family protein [Hyphomicrobium sp.]